MTIYFEIEADDPARAINFYTQVLGWRFSEDQGPGRYWRIEAGELYGGCFPGRQSVPPPSAGRMPLSARSRLRISRRPSS